MFAVPGQVFGERLAGGHAQGFGPNALFGCTWPWLWRWRGWKKAAKRGVVGQRLPLRRAFQESLVVALDALLANPSPQVGFRDGAVLLAVVGEDEIGGFGCHISSGITVKWTVS